MIRAIRGFEGLTQLRGPEPEAVQRGLRALGRFVLLAAAAFVLGRATLGRAAGLARYAGAVGGLAPFAMALFTAGVLAGRGAAPLLTGCALAALNGGARAFNQSLPLGCAVILVGELGWNAAGPALGWLRTRIDRVPALRRAAARRAPALQARSPNRTVRASTLAGLGVLGPGLLLAGGRPLPSALAVLAALAALAAAPFMRAALGLRANRRYLQPEERVGRALLCGALAAGLHVLWPPAAAGFSAAVAALMAPVGAGVGAGLGAALMLVSGAPRLLAGVCVCGATAQLCAGLKRAPRTLLAVAAGVAAGALSGAPPAELAGLSAAAPLALCVPVGTLSRALRPGGRVDADQLASALRARDSARLSAMAAAFGELAEGYLAPCALPDGQALMQAMRGALCGGCPGFDACWTRDTNGGARLLCDLVNAAVAWSESGMDAPLFEEGVPTDAARRCRRQRLIPERVGGMLEDFARTRRAELKRGGRNRLISAQFLQARQLLEAMAAEQARPVRLRDRQAARAAAALERAGFALRDALLLGGRQAELILTLREGDWTPELASEAARRLGEAFGRCYVPEGGQGPAMRFARLPGLAAHTGAACVPREAGAPSGDSHLTAALDDERLLAVICDGMGSGAAAARESSAAVRLLGRFMAAGAGWPLAVETVNAMMLGAGSDDMFSTMDLLLLNLSTGMAEFVKLAACPALIAREGAVTRVEGGRLPLGILEQVQPAAARVRLMPGDVVLMASDGVMDAVDDAALEALLLDAGEDMNALAERVLAAAAGHPDDMTVLCVRIERRDALCA